MSAVSSRPRVHSVTGAAAAAVLGRGVTFCASAIKLALQWCNTSNEDASDNRVRRTRAHGNLLSPAIARERLRTIASAVVVPGTSPAVLKRKTLDALAALPVAADEHAVDRIKALGAAETIAELETARRQLVEVLAKSHQHAFVRGVTTACRLAARQAGFTSVVVQQPSCGPVRVIATDQAGRALVSEIEQSERGDVSVASEVVSGGSGCDALLDVFDAALEHQGVRSERPLRRKTGGFCELRSAREVIRTRARAGKPTSVAGNPSHPVAQAVRARRLNVKQESRCQ